MSARPAAIKVRALQWLAQREHSREEMRGKLLRLLQRRALPFGSRGDCAAPGAEVAALLQWLEAQGYLSQQRFVESRVHARQARFGNLRIRQELQQHGVTLDADTQQALQCSEFDRARALWRQRYAGAAATGAADAGARLRQMRFLAGRGFSIDVVRRVLKAEASREVGGSDDSDSATG
jgi:regulatory protein